MSRTISKEFILLKKIVACYEKDYKQLKRMRWIRNQLVHDASSFQNNMVTEEDVQWLYKFRLRIMECSDPYSLSYQSKNRKRTSTEATNIKNILTEQRIVSPIYIQESKPKQTAELGIGTIIFVAFAIAFAILLGILAIILVILFA